MRSDVGEGRSKPEKQLARSAMARDTLFHLSMRDPYSTILLRRRHRPHPSAGLGPSTGATPLSPHRHLPYLRPRAPTGAPACRTARRRSVLSPAKLDPRDESSRGPPKTPGTTIVLGGFYAAFVVYIAMAYAESWLDRLRLLPLLTVAVTASLLGAVLIRKKHLMELRS